MSAPADSAIRSIDVRGVKVALRRLGAGEPLLYLHGPRGIDDPSPLLERLAARFTVFAPDHPGFGASDDPDALDTISDLAFFYADMLDELDLRGVHVVGHSLGGWIGLELAVRDASRLRTLTLAAAAGIRVDGVARGDMYIATPEELGRLLFHDPAHQADIARVEEDPDRLAIVTKNRVTSAKLTWHPRLYDPRLEKWLHRVRIPTLVLWGADDRVIPSVHAEAFARLIPHARTTLIPACGHLADVERPEAFAAAVTEFIEEASA